MAGIHANAPVSGTQLLVGHVSDVFKRPSLLGIEIAWRWLFGIPFLLVCVKQAQQMFAAYPLESSGFGAVSLQDPWGSSLQIAHVFTYYLPHVLAVMRWLLPAAALGWAVISGLGRNLVLMRLLPRDAGDRVPSVPFRPLAMIALQAGWLILLGLTFWGWFLSVQWAAATHILANSDPDLVGYSIWAIFLSLGFFSAFALVSWPLSIAPFLALLEKRSVFSGSCPELQARTAVHKQAGGGQLGHGHRQAVSDGAGHGLFGRAGSVRGGGRRGRTARSHCIFARGLLRRQRLLPGGAAQGVP